MDITREDLECYVDYKNEIEVLLQGLAGGTAIVSDTVKRSLDEFPYTETIAVVTGCDDNLRKQTEVRISELSNACMRVKRYIGEQKDSRLRTILELRFIRGMKWDRISREMGYRVASDTARKTVSTFLKENF